MSDMVQGFYFVYLDSVFIVAKISQITMQILK